MKLRKKNKCCKMYIKETKVDHITGGHVKSKQAVTSMGEA